MKNILLLLLLVSLKNFGQTDNFKFIPTGFRNQGFGLSYEHFIGNRQSIEFAFYPGTLINIDQNKAINIAGFEVKYRFFLPNRTTFKGVYLAPVATLLRTSEVENKRHLVPGIGGVIGYQFMFGTKKQHSGFIFDLNVGFSNYFNNQIQNSDVRAVFGFQPRFGIGFGYAFKL